MRQSTLSLAAILIVAGTLRFLSLGAGIPYAIGVDEPEIINRAAGMMRSGNLNPHFFDYPTLYIYVQLAVACARFMLGAMAGEWSSLSEVTSADFYLWGRAVTATFGTATVLLVYQIGLRWGTRPALLAAGLMAVMPLHVRESHYVLTDVPVTFFVTLAFLLALRAHEHQKLRGLRLGRGRRGARRRHQISGRAGVDPAADRAVDDAGDEAVATEGRGGHRSAPPRAPS